MSKFIEFSTTHPTFAEFSLGNPLHDSVRPSRSIDTAVVRVDGEPIEFIDESIPDKLHRTLVEMRRLNRDSYHCRQFVAMMNGISIDDDMPHAFTAPSLDRPVDPADVSVNMPVIIGVMDDSSPVYEMFWNRHMATPAHQPSKPTYLHKLGDGGPICLSGLQAAIDMYGCDRAFLPTYYD